MLKNHFKVALRSIAKNKSFAFIHIIGLTIGLTAVLFLSLYVAYEHSFDKQHKNVDNVYRLTHTRFVKGKETYTKASVFPEIGQELENNLSAVVESARLFPIAAEYEPVFTFHPDDGGPIHFTESSVYLADSSFTTLFDFKWINGETKTALSQPNQLILSQSLALKVFGTMDVIGKQLQWHGLGTWEIAGIFEDWPSNSHLSFNMLASWFNAYGELSLRSWDGFYTYILTRDHIAETHLAKQINDFATDYLSEYNESRDLGSKIGIQSLKDIHLNSHLVNEIKPNGNGNVVTGLLIMAIATLLIAVFNYVNLATSVAVHRQKEIGVRKVIGSSNVQVWQQLFVESFSIILLTHLLAITLVQLLLPDFNYWMGVEIVANWWRKPYVWIGLGGSVLVLSVLSGLYPAIIMIRFKAVNLMKNGQQGNHSYSVRQVLITTQFVFALVFSMFTLIVFYQVELITGWDKGFNEHLLVIKSMELVSENNDTTFVNRVEALKDRLRSGDGIKNATLTSHVPGVVNTWMSPTTIRGNDQKINTVRTRVDVDFMEVFGLQIVGGRFFNHQDELHPFDQIVVNERFARAFGYNGINEIIGVKLAIWNRQDVEIIGVIADFHTNSPQYDIAPALYSLGAGHKTYLSLLVDDHHYGSVVSQVESEWKQVFPNKPFEYFFLDNTMDRQFSSDRRLMAALGNFSGLAIFLAVLGLFGLSHYAANARRKELSIRKVLGASVLEIVKLLSKGHLKLILVAVLVALPVAYGLSGEWLNQYTTRIEIGLSFYLVPFFMIVCIAGIAITMNVLKVASANPVDNLRNE